MKWLVAVLVSFVAACGPSGSEIKTAKVAQYSAAPATLFDIALQVASVDYQIGETDPQNARFMTAPQMYSAEGGRQSPGAGGFVETSAGSIQLSLIVEVVKTERGHAVVITPKTFQVVSGSPKPRELAPDDPYLPGWVPGRVDSLALAIYEAAKPHVVP